MTLTLRIENEASLPDGGPLSVTIQGQRGIDIGRDSHLDWTLPDPTRFISGKHCEVRFRDGGYWLHDVSTNGTFLYGADHRVKTPHRLRHGDRLVIGNYIVAVTVEGDERRGGSAASGELPPPTSRAIDYQALWANESEIAPPIDPKQLKPAVNRSPNRPDFLDWAANVPGPVAQMAPAWRDATFPSQLPMPHGGPRAEAAMDWAHGPPAPESPPHPTADIPTPRRRSARDADGNPWSDPAPVQAASSPSISGHPASPTNTPSERGLSTAFLRQLASAAGLPDDQFDRADPDALAHELGALLRTVAENLMQLLSARAQAKRMARSAAHTMVQALDNNPLKFAPSAPEALRIMFGPPTESYLDAQRAFATSFDDLKKHQIKTYAAMQHALKMLMADLGPQAIDDGTEPDRGIGALLASRKAKLWDSYVARWQAIVRQGDGAPIEAFMLHFAEYYDRDGG